MIVLALSFVIIMITVYWSLVARYKGFDKVPAPQGFFMLKNTLEFIQDPDRLFYYTRILSKQYKRFFRLKFGLWNIIFLFKPEDIELLLTDPKCSKKSYVYKFITPWLQEGLLTSHGPKWQQRRKLLNPAFHFNVLTDFKAVIEENCHKLVVKLGKEVNETKTDITPYVNEYALHAICETAMGVKISEEEDSFGKMYKDGIYKLGQYAVYRAQRIWLHPDFLFNFSSVAKKQKNILKVLTSFRDRVIENRRKHINQSFDDINGKENDEINLTGKKKLAMLDLLLKAEKAGVIDPKGIVEEVDTVIFGGHDTSANTLQFAMMSLANYPETQEKVVQELDEIFGSSDRSPTMADLAQMKYLECCIKETLRLYPPVPMLARDIERELPLDDYVIPARTQCIILLYELHRRSDQFVEPKEFRPERFQTAPTWHPYGYLPFSAGSRNCIGQKFAMMELKQALSAVLRRYRILPVTKPKDIIFIMDFVLRAKEPIYVKLENRNAFTGEA